MNRRAKGSTVRATLGYVAGEAGPAALRRVLARIEPDTRAVLEQVAATGEVPYESLLRLWHEVDAEIGADDPRWIERSGAQSIASTGQQLYGGILRKDSPVEFLTQSVSLFRLYYQPGDMEVVEVGEGRAVLRLVGFDAGDRLFCRRQAGGLECAIAIAGGAVPTVRHVRCVSDGDAYCEWVLGWK